MSPDPYQDFADRYDLFYEAFDRPDPRVVNFFRELFEQEGVRRVLDCACGTGRDLYLFHTLGCEVIGSDISAAMLQQARKNLVAHDLSVSLHQVDYRQLPGHFDQRFDAVVCLSSSILHMPDDAEVLSALRSMGAVLRQGGILVLTQGTSDRQWRDKPRFILAVNQPDFSRLFVIDYLEQGARYHILDILHSETAQDFKVWSVVYPHMLLRDDYERLLREAGFSRVDCYGSYAFDPYDVETSDRLIVVAQW